MKRFRILILKKRNYSLAACRVRILRNQIYSRNCIGWPKKAASLNMQLVAITGSLPVKFLESGAHPSNGQKIATHEPSTRRRIGQLQCEVSHFAREGGRR